MGEPLRAVGVGVLAAGITYVLDPSPPWWLVGLMVAAVLYANPCRHR